jgi:hypothetical protein
MSEKLLHLEDSFWKFLVGLEELKEKKEIFLFCSSLGINEEQFEDYVDFVKKFSLKVEFNDQYIFPLKAVKDIQVKFSLAEWLAFQAALNLNQKREISNYSNQIIENKIKFEVGMHPDCELFQKPKAEVIEPKNFLPSQLNRKVEYNIISRKVINLHLVNGNDCSIFPHRLVYLDGDLSVIGESLTDKTLLYFTLEDIKDVHSLDMIYEPNLSQIEINEFIVQLRMINGKEERLVLKIYSQDQSDLLPENHYLGNPFVTASPEGDMIWAATIEMCDDIFYWLYQMRDRVEVLDPGHIRKEFAHYCELKKESKKAS